MNDIQLHFRRPPKLPLLLIRAGLNRKTVGMDSRPRIVACVDEIQPNPKALERYAQVCGFNNGDPLPATYPHIAAFGLHMASLLQPDFPFAPMGIVHTANSITQFRPLRPDEAFSLNTRIADYRDVDNGLEVDIVSEAYVREELVWSELTTVLKRGKSKGQGVPKRAPLRQFPVQQALQLPANLGRQYAWVSGDFNPIHLYPFTARALGFRRQIAHGMWSKARCLAELQGKLNSDCFRIEVEFKTPVFLPAATVLHSGEPEDGVIEFSLRNSAGNRPHLNGRLTAL